MLLLCSIVWCKDYKYKSGIGGSCGWVQTDLSSEPECNCGVKKSKFMCFLDKALLFDCVQFDRTLCRWWLYHGDPMTQGNHDKYIWKPFTKRQCQALTK